MFDLISFRDWLIKELYVFAGHYLVPNDARARPSKPFFAYTFTSPFVPQPAPPVFEYSDVVVEVVPDPEAEEEEEVDEPKVETYSRKQRTEYPTVVLSLTSVAASMQDCYDNILALRRWFALDGRRYLKSQDVVVARVGAVQDRSTILGGATVAEYRAGFDVAFRVCSQICIDIEHIEAVAVNDAEYRPETEEIDD